MHLGKLFIAILSTLLFLSTTQAVIVDNITEENQKITIPLHQLGNAKYLNQTSIQFCDMNTEKTGPTYGKTHKQGENIELCLMFINTADTGVNFRIGFSDQEVSNMGNRACGTDYDGNFSKLIKTDMHGNIFVDANSRMIKKLDMQIPFGLSGEQKGCISYGIVEDGTAGGLISIQSRKVLYMDFFVRDSIDISHQVRLENIKLMSYNNQLNISLDLINNSNIGIDLQLLYNIKSKEIKKSEIFRIAPQNIINTDINIENYTSPIFFHKIKFLPSYTLSFYENIENESLEIYYGSETYIYDINYTNITILTIVVLLIITGARKYYKTPKKIRGKRKKANLGKSKQ